MEPGEPLPLLARVRWGNVARAGALGALAALVVAWPHLRAAELVLPPAAPVPVAPAPRPPPPPVVVPPPPVVPPPVARPSPPAAVATPPRRGPRRREEKSYRLRPHPPVRAQQTAPRQPAPRPRPQPRPPPSAPPRPAQAPDFQGEFE